MNDVTAVGRLELVTEKYVTGWAYIKESDEPAAVKLMIDGQEKMRALADISRPELEKAGIRKGGLCGYRMELPGEVEIPRGAEVRVIFEVNGKDLHQSPTRLPDTPPYFFIHIPKTGGTSLRNYLEGKFPPAATLPDAFMIERAGANYLDPETTLRIAMPQTQSFRFLRGHFHYDMRQFFPERAKLVCLLREPVSRELSEALHVLRHHHSDHFRGMDLEQLLRSPAYPVRDNSQARYLFGDLNFRRLDGFNARYNKVFNQDLMANRDEVIETCKKRLDAVDFLGVTEHFDDLFRRINENFGDEPQEIPRLNIRDKKDGEIALSPEMRAFMEQRNQIDRELYDYVLKKLGY